MNEQDARQVFDTILQHERFSYREAVKWAISSLEANAAEIKALKEVIKRRGKSALPEVAALRAENEKLRAALQKIDEWPDEELADIVAGMLSTAEQALAAVEQSEAGDTKKCASCGHEWTEDALWCPGCNDAIQRLP